MGETGNFRPSKRIMLGIPFSSDDPCHIYQEGAGGERPGIITVNKGWVSTALVICGLGLILLKVEPHNSMDLKPSPLLICNQTLLPNLHKHHHLQIFYLSPQSCAQMASWVGAGRETTCINTQSSISEELSQN